MEEVVRQDILEVIREGLVALHGGDAFRVKELSNNVIHNASIFQDEDSLGVADIPKAQLVLQKAYEALSLAAIAKIESMPISTVYYVLLRNGVKTGMRRRMDVNQQAIVRMALLYPESYRAYADRKVAEKEANI